MILFLLPRKKKKSRRESTSQSVMEQRRDTCLCEAVTYCTNVIHNLVKKWNEVLVGNEAGANSLRHLTLIPVSIALMSAEMVLLSLSGFFTKASLHRKGDRISM